MPAHRAPGPRDPQPEARPRWRWWWGDSLRNRTLLHDGGAAQITCRIPAAAPGVLQWVEVEDVNNPARSATAPIQVGPRAQGRVKRAADLPNRFQLAGRDAKGPGHAASMTDRLANMDWVDLSRFEWRSGDGALAAKWLVTHRVPGDQWHRTTVSILDQKGRRRDFPVPPPEGGHWTAAAALPAGGAADAPIAALAAEFKNLGSGRAPHCQVWVLDRNGQARFLAECLTHDLPEAGAGDGRGAQARFSQIPGMAMHLGARSRHRLRSAATREDLALRSHRHAYPGPIRGDRGCWRADLAPCSHR